MIISLFKKWNPCFFCVLGFVGNMSAAVSLVMSVYGLTFSIGESWQWREITIVLCIVVTLLCNSIKEAVRDHPHACMRIEPVENTII